MFYFFFVVDYEHHLINAALCKFEHILFSLYFNWATKYKIIEVFWALIKQNHVFVHTYIFFYEDICKWIIYKFMLVYV